MGELKGGTTIAGFTAIHSGLKEIKLTGNILLDHPSGISRLDATGELSINTDGVVTFSNEVRANRFSAAGNIWWNSGSDDLNTLKFSVSDGKKKVAAAITDKGTNASGTETFSSLATKISNIKTGYEVGSVVPLNKVVNHHEPRYTQVGYQTATEGVLSGMITVAGWTANETRLIAVDVGHLWNEDQPAPYNVKVFIQVRLVDFQNPAKSKVTLYTMDNLRELIDDDQAGFQIRAVSLEKFTFIVLRSTYGSFSVFRIEHAGDLIPHRVLYSAGGAARGDSFWIGARPWEQFHQTSTSLIALTGKPVFFWVAKLPTDWSWLALRDDGSVQQVAYHHNEYVINRIAPLDLMDWVVVGDAFFMAANYDPTRIGFLKEYAINGLEKSKIRITSYISRQYYDNPSTIWLNHTTFIQQESFGSHHTRLIKKTINNLVANNIYEENVTTHWMVDLPVTINRGERKSNTEFFFTGKHNGEMRDLFLFNTDTGDCKQLTTDLGMKLNNRNDLEITPLRIYNYNVSFHGETSFRSLVVGYNIAYTLYKYDRTDAFLGRQVIQE